MQDIEIIKPGLFTTIQDKGRKGTAYFALPPGGAMDTVALEHANLLVHNANDFPAIECTLVPPTLLIHRDTYISLTGADMHWTIDGVNVDRYASLYVKKGAILAGKPSRDGARAYIGLGGMMKGKAYYGSQSTYSYAGIGGINGKPFTKGVFIDLEEKPNSLDIVKTSTPQRYTDIKKISFHKGPEWAYITQAAKRKITTAPFKLSSASDRMGARLIDHKIESLPHEEMKSVPIFPGVIQLPRSGDPLVILQDGQTTGGYPRIGIISASELDKFNQLLPNTFFHLELEQ